MTRIQRTFPVAPSVETVVAYLTDFANAEAWDPGTKSCVRSDGGPVQVGSVWKNISEFRGKETELTYTLTRREPGHLTFEGDNKTAHSVDDIVVRTAGGTTEITYTADITFKGVVKLAEPLLRGTFKKLGDDTVVQMTKTLAEL